MHIVINQKPTTQNTPLKKKLLTTTTSLGITDYSAFEHKLWHGSQLKLKDNGLYLRMMGCPSTFIIHCIGITIFPIVYVLNLCIYN
jgi:hypothetical protein